MEIQRFKAMGSQVSVVWDGPQALPAGWATFPDLFEEWEQCLSRFRPDSELARLNARAGVEVRVSATLAEVLGVALRAAAFSDGLVTPAVLPAMEAIGYTADFEVVRAASTMQSATEMGAADMPVSGTEVVTLANRKVTLRPGVRLDLGGIGKGWAADTLVRRFSTGSMLIDVGGDIAVSGPRADGSAWPISVHDPLTDGDRPLALLLLERGGVATSGRDYRHWRVGARAVHHIIDPRTGAPAATDVLAATVVAPTAVEAEVAAKVALIRGSEAGLRWLDERPAFAGLIVCENGNVSRSARWNEYDWALKNRADG